MWHPCVRDLMDCMERASSSMTTVLARCACVRVWGGGGAAGLVEVTAVTADGEGDGDELLTAD